MNLNYPERLAVVIFEDACATYIHSAVREIKRSGNNSLPKDLQTRKNTVLSHQLGAQKRVKELERFKEYISQQDFTDDCVLEGCAKLYEQLNEDIKNRRGYYKKLNLELIDLEQMIDCEDYFRSGICASHLMGIDYSGDEIIRHLQKRARDAVKSGTKCIFKDNLLCAGKKTTLRGNNYDI